MVAVSDKNRLFIWGTIVSPDSDKDLLGISIQILIYIYNFVNIFVLRVFYMHID